MSAIVFSGTGVGSGRTKICFTARILINLLLGDRTHHPGIYN